MTTHTEPTMVDLARVLNDAQGAANTPNNIEVAKEEVKAVLLALRQPSRGMVEAAFPITWQSSNELATPDIIRGEVAETFAAMIDAILSEGE